MKKALYFSSVASGLLLAGSCFGGLTGLTNGSAYTVTIDYDQGKADSFSYSLDGGTTSTSVGASLFELDVASINDLVVFCYELTESLTDPFTAQYTYYEDYAVGNPDAPASLTDQQINRLDYLFNNYYQGASEASWTAAQAQAFQLVVWELTYDSDLDITATSTGFEITGGNATVRQDAQDILDDAAFAAIGGTQGTVTLAAFINQDNQNQITTYGGGNIIIPEPSLIGLQALFVVGLLIRRRFRR